jgi:oligo-1,6-glucosidase
MQYKMVDQRSGSDPEDLAAAKTALQYLARDHARIPFSWDNAPNAGFSKVKPWMRAHDDYAVCNAKQQQGDKKSVLSFWKGMLELRRQHNDLFVHGDFDVLDMGDPKVFKYTKTWQSRRAYVVLNFTDKEQIMETPSELQNQKAEFLVSSAEMVDDSHLAAYEGRVYLL